MKSRAMNVVINDFLSCVVFLEMWACSQLIKVLTLIVLIQTNKIKTNEIKTETSETKTTKIKTIETKTETIETQTTKIETKTKMTASTTMHVPDIAFDMNDSNFMAMRVLNLSRVETFRHCL